MSQTDNHIEEVKLFHKLDAEMPKDCRMNNPFYYEPDELTMKAVRMLQANLPEHPTEGKMWGVLVVEKDGEVGFINAYSGQLCEADYNAIDEEWRGCPAVFDYLQPDGYFKVHEKEITDINHEIDSLTANPEYLRLKKEKEKLQQEANDAIEAKRKAMNEAKARRQKRRAEGGIPAEEQAEMTRESQFLKAEVHRAKVHFRELLATADEQIADYELRIESLKRRRSMLSDRLQAWLFSQFVLINARGERKPMPDIFRDYYASTKVNSSFLGRFQSTIPYHPTPSPHHPLTTPYHPTPNTYHPTPTTQHPSTNPQHPSYIPSGSGECCEPKMLQYAFLHGMKPLRIASFWWGPALGNEVRRHGSFYPACSGRCKPILGWMLQGLNVMPNPLEEEVHQKLKIIYEDDYLAVVGKPSGMLSVPGKSHRESVSSILADKWNGRWTPLSVHRLDMHTSGLLVVAKDHRTQRLLRRQFEAREIEKEYEAIVEGIVLPSTNKEINGKSDSVKSELSDNKNEEEAWDGVISLPLSPNLLDRPRQKVDFEHGKSATTKYRVLSIDNGETRLRLKPLTGRTHQLRVHCASPLGLNAPIKGDMLYGRPSVRLCLHAYRLSFVHPVTGRNMTFTLPAEF